MHMHTFNMETRTGTHTLHTNAHAQHMHTHYINTRTQHATHAPLLPAAPSPSPARWHGCQGRGLGLGEPRPHPKGCCGCRKGGLVLPFRKLLPKGKVGAAPAPVMGWPKVHSPGQGER